MKKKDQPNKRQVNYKFTEELLDAIDKLTARTRRTATEEVTIAVERHLKRAKLWPPPKTK